VDIDFRAKFLGPSPGASAVIQMDMRGKDMPNMRRLKSEFPNRLSDGVEYRFRPCVYQEQLLRSTFDECNANYVRYP